MTASTGLRATPALRAALRGAEPTSEQWAAITAPLDRTHLVAGAGSGKTAVMAARTVWLVERFGVEPAAVLGLTFTNKAAEELQERVRGALARTVERAGDDVTVSTYHAFAADLVRSHGVRVGVEPDASLLSAAQQYQLLLHLLEAERLEHLQVRSPGSVIQSVLSLAAACADHLVPPERVVEHAQAIVDRSNDGADMPAWLADEARERVELARLVNRYVEEKRRRGRIDFSDQITKAVELVEGSPEVAADLGRRWQHLLLDEYQDTNVAQRRLLQRLAGDGSILAVGDARQAIYAFRGATMYNLLNFSTHFPSRGHVPAGQPGQPRQDERPQDSPPPDPLAGTVPPSTVAPSTVASDPPATGPAGPNGQGTAWTAGLGEPLSLSVNFRSGRRILELANAVIEPVPAERRGGLPLVAAPGNGDGSVRAALLADQYTEAAFVADQVAAAHADPDGGLDWRDVAVLVRTKRLLGPLREALERRNIPVEVVGLSGLLETPEVVDLISVLRVLDDPGANVALARLLLGPRWRLSPRHLYRLTRWCARRNWELKEGLPGEDPDPGDVAFALSEALDHLDEVEGLDDDARDRLAAFRAELRDLRRAADGPLLGLVQTILQRTGVRGEIESRLGPAEPHRDLDPVSGNGHAGTAPEVPPIDRRAASARRNLTAFLDRVAMFAPVDGTPSLRAFLAYLDAVEEAAEDVEIAQPAAADSVKLMTVHQAKGLEFGMVAIAGLAAGVGKDGGAVNGIFPSSRVENPLNARSLPYELREDAPWLPRWTGSYRPFKAALTERALEDERRLFYVAVTRAKRLLLLTAAWWYRGADATPRGPGPFWREAAAHPAVEVAVETEQPEASPLADRLADRRAWPPPARRPEEASDTLFEEGHAGAVLLARRDPAALTAQLGPEELDAYAEALAAQRRLVDTVPPPLPAPAPSAPRFLSVAQVLAYARCARAFYWSVVRPLPAAPRPAARLGTLVHRFLEQRAAGTERAGAPGTDHPAAHAGAGGARGPGATSLGAPTPGDGAPSTARPGTSGPAGVAGPSPGPSEPPGATAPAGATGPASTTDPVDAAGTPGTPGTTDALAADVPMAAGVAGAGVAGADLARARALAPADRPGRAGHPHQPGRSFGGSFGELAGEQPLAVAGPGMVERATGNFAATRFATMAPPEIEVEVALCRRGRVIRGRIDAIYQEDGVVEVVDWKTGAEQAAAAGSSAAADTGEDAGGLDQLALYALALRELGRLPGDRCRVTYCYLGGEAPLERSRELGPSDLDHQLRVLDRVLDGIDAGEWPACRERSCEVCGRRA